MAYGVAIEMNRGLEEPRSRWAVVEMGFGRDGPWLRWAEVVEAVVEMGLGRDGQWSGRDRKSTRLNSSHSAKSRMPSSA